VGQWRALQLVRAERLSAATRAIMAAPVAPRTPALCEKALGLFTPAQPGLATTASVEAELPAALAAVVSFGLSAGVPDTLPREAVADAIRRAPRGTAAGPSSLRMEHLRALADDWPAALGGVVLLLVGAVVERLVPSLAAHAMAGADLLLLCKPGGSMLTASPSCAPLGCWSSSAHVPPLPSLGRCAPGRRAYWRRYKWGWASRSPASVWYTRSVPSLRTSPAPPFLQLDYRNAFNLVSRSAAVAISDASVSSAAAIPLFCLPWGLPSAGVRLGC